MTTKKHASHNIIFDLNDVLFGHCSPEIVQTHKVIAHIDNCKVYPLQGGVDLLKKCHAQKNETGNRLHKLFVLSNASTHGYEQLSKTFPNIMSLFDGVVLSSHLGTKKPDARLYQHLLTTHKLDPFKSIFIDDKEVNVHAARAFGMHGIVCSDFNHVEEQLKKFGII
jgi:FMN phosphatase YigB (HAD superfamily)